MKNSIRSLLFGEGAAFGAAALTHFGALMGGYEHRKAGIAESAIGLILLLALLFAAARPASARAIAVAAQSFALFGTLVGISTIAIGVGPRTAPDIVYHVVMVAVLTIGLVAVGRPQTIEAPARRRS